MPEKSEFMYRLKAEVSRGFKVYTRYRAWLLSDILQWPFWIIFFFLSIVMYSPSFLQDPAIVKTMTYSFFVFVFVSSFMWNATSMTMEAQQGILENLILAKTPLRVHMVGRAVITLADLLVGGVILLLLSRLFFGADISIALPIHFAASLLIAFVFFQFFTAILAALLLSVKSPWIVAAMLQFIIPFSSGALPIQFMPPEYAEILMRNPFFYVLHPIVASATGIFHTPPEIIFPAAIATTTAMALIAIYGEKRLMQKALKTGKFYLF